VKVTNWGFEDDNAGQANHNEGNGPKALREAYEAMKKQNDELSSGLAAITKQLNDQRIASTFETLGVPAAAKLYQGDADPEKIKTWVDTMKTAFGNTGTSSPSEQTAPLDDPDLAAQYQRMSEAGQSGVPLGSAEQAMGRVGDAKTPQDLINAFKMLNHQ
jgi:hypothetical protein